MRAEANDTAGDSSVEVLPVYANINMSAASAACAVSPFSSSSLLETGGDYVGDIHMYQFDAVPSITHAYTRSSGRHGIFVGGKFEGDVTVNFDYSHADMIARSFRGAITVGKFFEGCIVAVGHATPTDGLDGTIGTVSIGNNGVAWVSGQNKHGFSGKYTGSIMPAPFEITDTYRLNC